MNIDLPILGVLPELRQALHESRCGVLCAPPGSGKTTLVPMALRTESWLGGRSILLVEPRRLAARLAAVYMAEQLGEEVGQSVGYQVRFDRKISSRTRVEVITEGILTRRLQQDPELPGVGLVIFDEFHERSLESDVALALCLEARAALRDDLRLLVMSATIAAEPVGRLLGGAPVVTCRGKMYPVEVRHLPPPARTDSGRADHIAINVANGVRRALVEQQGDILAFLPGAGEIRRAVTLLASSAAEDDFVLLPLYGDLSLADQSRAVRPDPRGRRRVILATTIAETSITIEGIGTVVDCGWKRVPRFDPNCGLTRLATVRISRASAVQRQGRAGRLGPGVCYRLWGGGVEYGLQDFDRPEILEADLTGLALQLAAWGDGDPGRLQWLDPPPPGAFAAARTVLTGLGALDKNGRITSRGRDMAGLPLHPRLAHMLLNGRRLGCLSRACDLAALLSERDIQKDYDRSVDIADRLHLLRVFREEGAGAARALGADAGGCRRVDRISRQLGGLLAGRSARNSRECRPGVLLALSFPDRIARQRPGTGGRYKLASGHGACLMKHDRISFSPYLVIAALDAGKREGRIFLAAVLDKDDVLDLFAGRLVQEDEIKWDEKTAAVAARRLTRLGDLVIAERSLPHPDPEAVQAAFLDGIRRAGLEVLPWSKEARALQERVKSLFAWQPAAKWPDLSDECLRNSVARWLAPFLTGIRTREQLRALDMAKILRSLLDWDQQRQLEQDAPTHIRVPSGSRIKLRYAAGEPPVLAVRLQEMFGLAATPTVCRGRVPVTLHLLSPARRPLQVTSDLRGFWDGSYHEVKKEMKGRYPKHYWPDDPWQATPTSRVKPRK
ncbi:ATP-dependent RNA helicase HrpB [bacterium BMS3Bbin14]|nr:ATP-dependent RNA helicase HrpB [bacterium BMS3Abin13]GBE52365.1 ATP-dependent RNA helicase HrpB [bacterium BMS3Bbin14]